MHCPFMEEAKCVVCGDAMKYWDNGGGPNIQCSNCGNFKITDMALQSVESLSASQKGNLSGWLREHPNTTINTNNIGSLSELKPPSVGEKADRVLMYLAKLFPKPGGRIYFEAWLPEEYVKKLAESESPSLATIGALRVITWSEDTEEVDFILQNYLRQEKQFLEMIGEDIWRITPKGWAHLYSLSHSNVESNTAFIAMWFSPTVDEAYQVIEAGIAAAGFAPLRIDKKEHNNKIDDEIIAAVRRSRFVVADFTGHRGGVYYEAGYAGGRDIPVIWLCRKDDLANIHFDTRQFNFLLWEPDKLADLQKKLLNRIEATIGRGKNHS